MARNETSEVFTLARAYESLTLDTLRPLAGLLGLDSTLRKTEIVPSLLRRMSSEEQVKRLYEALEPVEKSAIQEAAADPLGRLDPSRFQAKYGGLPKRGYRKEVSIFDGFFPRGWSIPVDLAKTIRTFVPAPSPITLESADKLPETVPEQRPRWSHQDGKAEPQLISLRQRLMDAVAPREFTTVLRLAETGRIKVSEKTRKPAQATVELIEPLLEGGGFYETGDRAKHAHDPAYDLAIRSFAWPCILQASGLVSLSGGRLELSKAGRKALGQEMHLAIRDAWKKWLNTKLFDEFERIEVIKGKSPARLSSVVDRRRAVSQVLAQCPPGKWIDVDEFFRYLKALDHDFTLARDFWKLYIVDDQYGSLGYDYSDAATWKLLQGRFILVFLFEYAATLGLVDVAYIPPQFARNDYRDRWGADDYSSLSRYDGLKFFRLNALGAWCLGAAESYQPELTTHKVAWRVLPNLEVVSVEARPNPSDVLFLERVAQRTSESAWRLDREKLLRSVESGLAIDLVATFLANHSDGAVPSTVSALLDDLQRRIDRIKDMGIVRLIECSDVATVQTLLLDPKLKTLCQAAGKRGLIFKATAESQVREQLRKLGYVLPSS